MDIDMVPIQLRNFKIDRPGETEIQWLHHVVAHQYGRFGGKVAVKWKSRPMARCVSFQYDRLRVGEILVAMKDWG